MFEHQERLFASLSKIADGLAESAPGARTATMGIALLTAGGVGIPKELADRTIRNADEMLRALYGFRAAVIASQGHA